MGPVGETVKQYILKEFLPGEDSDQLTETTPLITSGILDSLATLKLSTFLENEFDIQMEAHELDDEHIGSLAAIEQLTSFASSNPVARLSIDQGIGPETVYEPQPATVTLSGTPVSFPVGGFLQATEDGEAALAACVREAVDGSARVADLFAGLGTFTLAVGASYAAEASRDAAAALKRAAPHVAIEHRDLYRRPLDPGELKRFDAVIVDPPRAGAEEQVRALAASSVRRIAYVSCNPATFARDAKALVDGGYSLDWVRPVGQFRWSTHVELAACFTRDK